MEKKLSVNNLTISFTTQGGKVQAVRDINFVLNKGETLAIVGESGSGKSVTSRAIMGILAGNAIVEGGEIIYDGQDLLRISEDDFHKIRGDRIAMIFQDPLSSLNPIMKIGKQLTEAMIIKGKMRQNRARKIFNATLKRLCTNMINAEGENITEEKKKSYIEECNKFDKAAYKQIELESDYNKSIDAHALATDVVDTILQSTNHIKSSLIKQLLTSCSIATEHKYINQRVSGLSLILADIERIVGNKRGLINRKDLESIDFVTLKKILDESTNTSVPDFYALGYYLAFSDSQVTKDEIVSIDPSAADEFLRKDFLDKFTLDTKRALEYSHKQSQQAKSIALGLFDGEMAHIKECGKLDRKSINMQMKKLCDAIIPCIDQMEIVKDSLACTFKTSIKAEIKNYFEGGRKNKKEQKRFDKQNARMQKLKAAGKATTWKVVPPALTDLELKKQNIIRYIQRLKLKFLNDIEKDVFNSAEKTKELFIFLKENASAVVHIVTKSMAKNRAMSLMEEVGIPEVRQRYKQYPFQLSGGMRQRIVIAIALAADPDILICDEPTTALDVTIQAQILELINKIKRERALSVIFITHDFGVVANMADRIAVMYAGKIVECGSSEDIFYSPAHPYTWALLSSMPDLDTKDKLEAIPGTPPNMIFPPKGDAFAARNKYAMEIDFEEQPPMFDINETHQAATWLLHPSAPEVSIPKALTDRIARMKRGEE